MALGYNSVTFKLQRGDAEKQNGKNYSFFSQSIDGISQNHSPRSIKMGKYGGFVLLNIEKSCFSCISPPNWGIGNWNLGCMYCTSSRGSKCAFYDIFIFFSSIAPTHSPQNVVI